jgi:hypothetical protein
VISWFQAFVFTFNLRCYSAEPLASIDYKCQVCGTQVGPLYKSNPVDP